MSAPNHAEDGGAATPVLSIPATQDAIFQLRQIASHLINQGQDGKAEYIYRQILEAQPDAFDILSSLAILEYRQMRFVEALRDMQRALASKPGDILTLTNLGLVQAILGQPQDALASYDKALSIDPDFAQAHSGRGDALMRLDRPAEALESYERALALRPDYAEALNNRGATLLALMRFAEALDSYDRAIAIKPDFPDSLNGRGNTLLRLGRPAEALENYERALAVNPALPETHNNRGVALRDLKQLNEALASYDQALALQPDYVQALNNRGTVLADLSRADEALASYDQAIALCPEDPELHDNRALLLAQIGRFDAAWAASGVAIRLAPDRVRFHYNLTAIRRVTKDDPSLAALRRLAARADNEPGDAWPIEDRIELNYALGKALDDIGDHAEGFRRLSQGAALKRRNTTYDEASTLGLMDRARAVFTPDLMSRRAGLGDPSETPVFIVGMPRSGTSLVEQILASHPRVYGAGETDEFARALAGIDTGAEDVLFNPEAVAALPAEQLARIGATYLARLRDASPSGARRIVDKTMENFRLVGQIRLALPGAKVVHVRRDPLDTCVSCFTKLFTGYLPFTYELGELGRYYSAYEALMAHWRTVTPPEVLMEVRYEDLVADFEPQARRIVTHCGLDWDPRCLEFHRTERPVRTASVAQVREPIHSGAIGRWRVYESFLGPLIDALGFSQT